MKATKQGIVPIVLAVLVGSVISAPLGAGSVYKWTDNSGRVHYGDKPRSTAQEISITPRAADTTSQPTDAERKDLRQRLLNMYQEERERARVEAENKNKRKARAARNCALARDRLVSLERSAYVYKLDERGERVVLSDQHRDQAIRSTRSDIVRWCKQTARK